MEGATQLRPDWIILLPLWSFCTAAAPIVTAKFKGGRLSFCQSSAVRIRFGSISKSRPDEWQTWCFHLCSSTCVAFESEALDVKGLYLYKFIYIHGYVRSKPLLNSTSERSSDPDWYNWVIGLIGAEFFGLWSCMYTQKTMCFNHYSFAFRTPYMESEHISVSLFSRHFFQPQRQLHCEGTTACPSHWSPKTYHNWELPCFHHRTTWQRASSLPPDMTDTAWLLFPVEDTWSHLFLHHGQNSTLWTFTIPACAEFHYMHPVIGLSRCTRHLLHRFSDAQNWSCNRPVVPIPVTH